MPLPQHLTITQPGVAITRPASTVSRAPPKIRFATQRYKAPQVSGRPMAVVGSWLDGRPGWLSSPVALLVGLVLENHAERGGNDRIVDGVGPVLRQLRPQSMVSAIDGTL